MFLVTVASPLNIRTGRPGETLHNEDDKDWNQISEPTGFHNFVPRVSLLPTLAGERRERRERRERSLSLSSLSRWGEKKRDPGNEVPVFAKTVLVQRKQLLGKIAAFLKFQLLVLISRG